MLDPQQLSDRDRRSPYKIFFDDHPRIKVDRRGSYESGRRRHPRYFFPEGLHARVQTDAVQLNGAFTGSVADISAHGVLILFSALSMDSIRRIMAAPSPFIHLSINKQSFSLRAIPLRVSSYGSDSTYQSIAFEFVGHSIPEVVLKN